jgi:hypothetical protein
MNKIITIGILFLSIHSYSQTSISDCEGAIVLCNDVYSEDQASFNTGNIVEFTGNCNGFLEQSSVWYTFTVQEDGTLAFTLTPNTLSDDYDWGLFDITTGGCAGIGSTSLEVSCNSWGTFSGNNGPTGISTAQGGVSNSGGPGDTNGPPFNSDLNVTAGTTYALVVMNWTNSLDGYTIDFGESTASLYDNVPPSPISVDVSCSNNSLTLNFSEPIVSSSVQTLDFAITDPNGLPLDITGAITFGGNSQDDQIVIDLSESLQVEGTYTLTITDATGLVEDACGNLGEGSITFEVVNLLTFDISTNTACNGIQGSIAIENIQGGSAPYTYQLDGIAQTNPTFSNLDDGSYEVAVVQQNGCTITQTVNVPNSLISVEIPLQDTLSCLNAEVSILSVNVQGDSPFSFSWTSVLGVGIADGSNSISPTINLPGIYTLEVTNVDGCVESDIVAIEEGELAIVDLSTIVFPNVFTPNGDAINPNWKPFLRSNPTLDLLQVLDEYNLIVYNRWGEAVFETEGRPLEFDASDLSDGTYFYHVEYATNCGNGDSGIQEGTIYVITGK